ncbi:hypothetical protein [Sulfolobus acidocaldarius]|uniref:Conserved Archaeal protein n=4 Tax=Sulfolobus acidocaldarius TaxID=2285 RepID=Q4J7P4_SULAC|nr:hypothetical protein [Sulfolobus acidocaldarius]AAY81187.1 conserved Archaeal protein [Sulfolobus acidocaldarius DSM 639]AGE71805.1 hypothetical protein SacN8_09225 [Sulfolobus acidocaldarius N8]AGE74076.1 hypothetical protein SacRon12I_09245 [Sulfolobus acidocaldarius Ron12/I]ALU30001.1 VapB-type antitoxin [Sulfolobus acidocaldarius]ALU30691.1 VapB-type antitoxin [Sulfolobus acidocaldarius]
MSDVISVRVRKELKRRAEELGINLREVVERALEEAIRKKEMERVRTIAKKIQENMQGISEEEWAQLVRESRDER